MKIYNILDEENRFLRFIATTEYGSQEDSHTFSYMFLRQQYLELDMADGCKEIEFGLGLILKEECIGL